MNFRLNRLAFAYGNIKPDFHHHNIPHSLADSIFIVNEYAEKLKRENISVKEFSIALGAICHFICDYFCLYHRDGNEKKGAFEHTIYEMVLHVKLLTLLLSGQLSLNNYDLTEDSIEAIIDKLGSKYHSEAKGFSRDIDNALLAAAQVSKLMIASNVQNKMCSKILKQYA